MPAWLSLSAFLILTHRIVWKHNAWQSSLLQDELYMDLGAHIEAKDLGRWVKIKV